MDFIRRHQSTLDELPPWAGISFKLSIESDTLSEDLKRAYPACLTHRERKHQAAIDFLQGELERMRSKETISCAAATLAERDPSEAQSDEPKAYMEIVLDRSRPQSASSSTSPLAASGIHSPVPVERAKSSSVIETDPGALCPFVSAAHPQQFVWSAQSGQSMRPKTKRKMTVEERGLYREVRKKGACETCKKQKCKCRHTIDGELQPRVVEAVENSAKRWISTGLHSGQPNGTEHLKLEHASAAHQPAFKKRHQSEPAVAVQHSVPEHAHRHIDQLAGATHGNGQCVDLAKAAEYVSDHTIVSFSFIPPSRRNPWPPNKTHDFMESTDFPYTQGFNIHP